MMNKKGVSFLRVILYIVFAIVGVMLLYSCVCAYRKVKPNSTTDNVSCSLPTERFIYNYNGDSIYNLYNKSDYPFLLRDRSGNSDNTRAWTGSFMWINPGTYTISVPSSFVNTYKFAVVGSSTPSFIVNSSNEIYDTGWITSSSRTFTISSGMYFGIYGASLDGNSNVTLSDFINCELMFNEGNYHSYLDYDSNFANALDYVDNAYFVGSFAYNAGTIWGYDNTWAFFNSPDMPFSLVSNGEITVYRNIDKSTTIYNTNDLFIGDNISLLYTDLISNPTYSSSWYGSGFNTKRFDDTLYYLRVGYDTITPIPINYFNFTFNGSDTLSNSNTRITIYGNDDIVVSTTFNNTNKFLSQYLLNINPNLTHIIKFEFDIYANTSIIPQYNSSTGSNMNNVSWDNIGLQNKTWSSYSSFCNFHIAFDNYYGDSQWQAGFDEGYRQGLEAGDEALRESNDYLQNKVIDLSSQVDSLNSRVNQQTEIITQLNNELQQSQNNFKGLFFTFADIPFKTVSNALGFEFWGVNLFRFFVGIITALGIVWLIKKII